MIKAEYIAGVFDGEGSILIGKYPNKGNRELGYRGYMHIVNTYVPLLEQIQSVYGGKIAFQKQHGVMTRPCYSLTFSTNEIRHVLPKLLPYLLVKKEQAEVLLAFLERQASNASAPVSDTLLEFYEASYQQMKQLKVVRFEYARPPETCVMVTCAQCEKLFERSSRYPRKLYCSNWCKRKTHWTRSNSRIALGVPAWNRLLPVAQQEGN